MENKKMSFMDYLKMFKTNSFKFFLMVLMMGLLDATDYLPINEKLSMKLISMRIKLVSKIVDESIAHTEKQVD